MSEEVKCFKLSTGEEVISRVSNMTADKVVLDRPRRIELIQQAPGQMGMTLIPFTLGDENCGEVTLYRDHVVAEFKPKSDLEKGYLQNTSAIQLLD